VFTGYREVRVIAEAGSLDGPGVKEGDSYQVLSAHPRHSIERLHRSRAGWVGSRYLALPGGPERLRELARQINRGADSDFTKLERIMGYLALQGKFDPHRPGDLTSSASLDEFLFEGKPGSALDYATATVMLARASGLPSRLAVGYLPGVRDPLSGAYMVRKKDAHA
jgi:transglutaminase-like putative cysteine protease